MVIENSLIENSNISSETFKILCIGLYDPDG